MSPFDVTAVYPLVSQGTTYAQSASNAISWKNNVTAEAASIQSVRLDLGTGSANSVSTLYTLDTLAYPASTCYGWTPAANLSTSSNYTIIFTGLDGSGNTVSINYCTWFAIAYNGIAPTATQCPTGTTVEYLNSVSNSSSAAATTAQTATSAASVATTPTKTGAATLSFHSHSSFVVLALASLAAVALF
ncbi:hypothetical protein HDU83_000111 [Entophlyctis luteolus]|nr:hypothetical protein HDU82_004542 [Entophlyctis luteolus]KAJ3358054.1 hypothetical protein HDU83_000111 [Entophlyctis luteolus]KAJ3395327.1 hypothetical protein HDU84_000094 [Entophlyctis sp. JEL0112]